MMKKALDPKSEDILKLLGKKRDSLARQLLESDDEDGFSVEFDDKRKTDSEEEEEPDSIFASAFKETLSKGQIKVDEEEEESESEEEFDDGYDDDLMGDDDDRKRLMLMTEVEREAILYERDMARQKKLERWELKKKLRAERLGKVYKPSPQKMNSMKRGARPQSSLASTRSDNLWTKEVYKKKFIEQSTREMEDGEDNESIETPIKAPVIKEEITLDHVLRMQLKRYKIEKWVYRSFFKKDLIGCFIRAATSHPGGETDYSIYQIEDIVDSGHKYFIDKHEDMKNKSDATKPEIHMTNLAALVKSRDKTRKITFNYISNSPITMRELNKWMDEKKQSKSPMLPIKEVEIIAKRISDLDKKPITEYEINYMLKEKSKFAQIKKNPTAQKAILMNERLEASMNKDEERVKEIDEELHRLDDIIEKSSVADDRVKQLELINKKNRELNIKIAREAELEYQRVKDQKAQDDILNPFKRRKTRSTFADLVGRNTFTNPNKNLPVPEKAVEPVSGASDVSTNIMDAHHDYPSESDVGPRENIKNLFEPNDMDIDIDIDLPPSLSTAKQVKKPTKAFIPQSLVGIHQYKKEHGLF